MAAGVLAATFCAGAWAAGARWGMPGTGISSVIALAVWIIVCKA